MNIAALTLLAAVTIGKPAPDFSLKDEAGKQHALKDYRGKIVVLEWTNSKCPFVQHHYEKGTMKTLAARFSSKDVVWLAVNSTHSNQPSDSKAWTTKWSLQYPTLQDASGTVGKLYDAQTTPHMYVIDKEGIVRYAGAIDNDPEDSNPKRTNYIDNAVSAVLAGKAPDPSETKPYGCSVKYK